MIIIRYIEYLIFRVAKSLLSVVPFRILYMFSDVCSLLLQYIVQYRLKTIWSYLSHSFPRKSNRKILQIIHQYYKYLCDVLLESVKGYSASTESLLKRCKCLNPEIADRYFANGQDIIIALSHYGNWEWGTQAVSALFKHEVISFYKPMSNKYIDAYMQKLRTLWGMQLLSIYEIHRMKKGNNEKPRAYLMVSDQIPSNSKKIIGAKFFNRDTACSRNIEYYSKLHSLPVLYMDIKRLSRGYYTVEMLEICANPTKSANGEITQIYMSTLESIISKQPEYWLWSRRNLCIKKNSRSLLNFGNP